MTHLCSECNTDISHKAAQCRRCDTCKRLIRITHRTKWNKRNPEVLRKAVKKWIKNNPERRAWYRRSHKNNVKSNCPVWVDKNELKQVYSNCPSGFEVDHIVPLKGKIVSGLHVPWNLQYLTREANLKKTNRLDYEELF